MSSVRILHASDLHISIFKNMVSPVDHLAQLAHGSISPHELPGIARQAWKAFRQKMTASSYDPSVLKLLSHFIYDHAKEKIRNDEVLREEGKEKIDAVLLSGDLATTGTVRDMERVNEFLWSEAHQRYPYENLNHEATLSAVASPIWFLPGNHDRFIPSSGWTRILGVPLPRFFDPGATNFDERLADFQTEPAQELGAVPDWHEGPTPFRVVVLAADFSLKKLGDHDGDYGWLAQGRVYENVLELLVEKTEAATRRHEAFGTGNLCLLWAVHYPPSFPHISHTSGLLQEEDLIAQANRCGVAAILPGHTHEQFSYRKPSMNFEVLCCGSTTQFVPSNTRGRNRLQILEFSGDPSSSIKIAVENYVFKRAGERGAPISYFYPER